MSPRYGEKPPPWKTSICRLRKVRSVCCWVHRAVANPRPCASLPDWKQAAPAKCGLASATSLTCQQHRVALGRALVAQAQVCLMDEPLSNLDAQLRQDMRRELRDIQRQLGLTVVYVTHDQTEAMSMADQVVLLNSGQIEQVGTPRDLYLQPGTRFAARFIGQPPMNLLAIEEGSIAGSDIAIDQ